MSCPSTNVAQDNFDVFAKAVLHNDEFIVTYSFPFVLDVHNEKTIQTCIARFKSHGVNKTHILECGLLEKLSNGCAIKFLDEIMNTFDIVRNDIKTMRIKLKLDAVPEGCVRYFDILISIVVTLSSNDACTMLQYWYNKLGGVKLDDCGSTYEHGLIGYTFSMNEPQTMQWILYNMEPREVHFMQNNVSLFDSMDLGVVSLHMDHVQVIVNALPSFEDHALIKYCDIQSQNDLPNK